LKATQESLKVAQEGQITERFTRAIEQLGSDKLQIRLGGIYALERISTESKKDYWPIMEILSAYIRKNSSLESEEVKKQNKIAMDIQAILTVIRRREDAIDAGKSSSFDLQKTYLQEAYLGGANLEETNLEGADLQKANLEKANLQRANLRRANLKEANLWEANLEDAYLEGANLREAYLGGAYLIWTNLMGTDLEEANLIGANLLGTNLEGANLLGTNLEGANLLGANLKATVLLKTFLEGANLVGANLEDAYLEDVYLEGANLKGAKSLTVGQLSRVKTLYKAKLDLELEKELRAKGFGKLIDVEPER